MRRLVCFFLFLAAAFAAHATETGARYAVLSLLSDELTVVVRGARTTGSSIDHNVRQALPMPSHVLDKRMAIALDDALHAAGVATPAMLLFTTDATIFERQAQLLGSGQGASNLLDAIRPVLKGVDARYLVVASKYRHDAVLRLSNGSIGSGVLSGLGFYVDTQVESYETNGSGVGTGFVAAYAYFLLSLVDLETGRIVREVPVMASQLALGFRSETGNPWDAMTAQEKVASLERLLRVEARRAIPELIAP